jgi:cytidylate kinase
MYRAVTYGLLKRNIVFDNQEEIKKFLDMFSFDVKVVGGVPHYFMNNEEVTSEIRSPQVNDHVSEVAANAVVRGSLLSIQHNFAKGQKVVFEGRDMGTTVFPEAEVKIFLTARPAVRAERRYAELQAKHPEYSREEILENLLNRDHADASREASPLRQPADAHLIDTSDIDIDGVVERILSFVGAR